MKANLSILIMLFVGACNLNAQINCGNGTTDSAASIVAQYNPTSTPTVHKVDFNTVTAIPETTGGITVWLKVDGSISPAPTITSVTGDVILNQSLTNNELGDGNHYYLLNSSSQINPSVLFIENETRTVATVTFNTAIPVGMLEIVLTSPLADDAIDFGGGQFQYYRTAVTVCNGDEDSYIAPAANILPISLKSFTAVPFQNRDANLDWVTATEVNGSHFEVERSDDGVNFTQIGRVEATGNSAIDQDYKFSDREVNMERSGDVVQYYRIKMVDIDGEYKYSGVRVVNFTRSDIDFTINAFPNPTVNFVQLELTGLDNTSTDRPTLNIYCNTGELIRSETLNSDLGKIDMSNLPSSLYHFIIDYKGQRYTEKIVVIK